MHQGRSLIALDELPQIAFFTPSGIDIALTFVYMPCGAQTIGRVGG